MSKIKYILKKSSILKFIYPKFVALKGKIRFWYKKNFSKVWTEEMLIKKFPELGIFPKDKIIINSSMSKIGILQNGPETFVNALKRYITDDGLIVMSTYPHRNSYEYLENYEVFDVLNTPSKNGALTEYFRKSEGVVRSIHPTHSLAAWGKNAKEIMAGHEKSKRMYDIHSPYKKLLDLNVKNFLIGVNFDHMVMIRAIDDLYEDYPIYPYIKDKVYKVDVKGYDGEIIQMETVCHDPVYFSKERYNMRMFEYLKDKIIFGKLGGAETWVLSSQDMFSTQVECAKKGIYAFHRLRNE